MVPERLWTAFRFIPWEEDMFRFHARLFRCFLLAHADVAFGSRGPARVWALLGQRLADVGLVRDAGHLHEQEPDSYPVRCPPKRRYEATSWSAFVTHTPMDQTVPLPPSFIPQPIYNYNPNTTGGLHDKPRRSAVIVDITGLGHVLGYDGLFGGAVLLGFLLLWLLTLANVVLRWRARLHATRAMYRLSRVAIDATTSEHMVRRLLLEHLAGHGGADTRKEVGRRVTILGARLVERREQSMLEEPVLHPMSASLFHSFLRMGIKAWVDFSGLTKIFVTLDLLKRGSNGVVTIGRQSKDSRSPEVNESDLDVGASFSMPMALDGTKQSGVPPDWLPSEFRLIKHVRDSTLVMLNRRCEPLAIGDVAINEPDPARIATPDVARGDQNGLPVASSNRDHGSYQEVMPSDGDASASEDGSDRASFGEGTQHADGYRVLGRWQDRALSDTGCARRPGRARSAGHLRREHDMSDDDDETGDDSYWAEQVNARLSGEQDTSHAPCRYGWTDGSSWPREGREDETDNWRMQSPQVTHVAAQVDDNGTKVRRYSSPQNASFSHRAGSVDGVYVVPQRRGSRCWSSVSNPQPSDQPSGLGFSPFRKTPSLSTPEAWRPGCLYVPDPPVDESTQADAWWDSPTRGVASAGRRTGTEMDDMREHGSPFSRDGPVSWRDRHENNPASRRIISAHQRATTEG